MYLFFDDQSGGLLVRKYLTGLHLSFSEHLAVLEVSIVESSFEEGEDVVSRQL